jgi:hypothetical protein
MVKAPHAISPGVLSADRSAPSSAYDAAGLRPPTHATFHTTEMEHSPTSATGTAWDRTPWRATRRVRRTASY